jgi:hypothetical protein
MQVFTTIFLARMRPADIPDQNSDPDQDKDCLADFRQALRERITMLEARGWFEDEGFEK